KAQELRKLNPKLYEAVRAQVFSSRLPSDPGLAVVLAHATLEEKEIPKRSIFGRQFVSRETGQPETELQRLVRGASLGVRVEDVPVFYLPFLQGDANDPLGPLRSLSFNYNRIFGFQAYSTFNLYDLVGIDPLPGTRWKLYADYLSERGPALGTDFEFAGKDLLGVPNRYTGIIKAYGIRDTGPDILGRGEDPSHPEWRSRFLGRLNVQELPAGFTVQTQASVISDRNFMEQYYKIERDT